MSSWWGILACANRRWADPDTSFFFSALPHQDAHETLLYALSAGEGFLVVKARSHRKNPAAAPLVE